MQPPQLSMISSFLVLVLILVHLVRCYRLDCKIPSNLSRRSSQSGTIVSVILLLCRLIFLRLRLHIVVLVIVPRISSFFFYRHSITVSVTTPLVSLSLSPWSPVLPHRYSWYRHSLLVILDGITRPMTLSIVSLHPSPPQFLRTFLCPTSRSLSCETTRLSFILGSLGYLCSRWVWRIPFLGFPFGSCGQLTFPQIFAPSVRLVVLLSPVQYLILHDPLILPTFEFSSFILVQSQSAFRVPPTYLLSYSRSYLCPTLGLCPS